MIKIHQHYRQMDRHDHGNTARAVKNTECLNREQAPVGEFKSSLEGIQGRVITGMSNPMIIHRSRILQSTLAAVRRPSFHYDRLIEVEFSGEEAQDYGGPRREYLRYGIRVYYIHNICATLLHALF